MIIVIDDIEDDNGRLVIKDFINKKRLILADFKLSETLDSNQVIEQEITLTLRKTDETITKEDLFVELL
jgi:hypothetical protein